MDNQTLDTVVSLRVLVTPCVAKTARFPSDIFIPAQKPPTKVVHGLLDTQTLEQFGHNAEKFPF